MVLTPDQWLDLQQQAEKRLSEPADPQVTYIRKAAVEFYNQNISQKTGL